jgi:sterol desaturase/sphingolipid hydroxylase (fatty acid hydroxylase superfamily)
MDAFARGLIVVRDMPLGELTAVSLGVNVAQFLAALGLGELLIALFRRRAVFPVPPAPPLPPITRRERFLAASCVLLNSLVMVVGFRLWHAGIIRVVFDFSLARVLLDTLVLFIAMDLAMYVLHRVAHHPRLFPIIHATHHEFEHPRPLTLFVLNPFEVLGFGALWLLVVSLYPASWPATTAYLTLNLLFGLVGHLGVEPMPGAWLRIPLLRSVSTSTFHAEHHADRGHNYGFYLTVWDRLLGTLSPDYTRDFLGAGSAGAPSREG